MRASMCGSLPWLTTIVLGALVSVPAPAGAGPREDRIASVQAAVEALSSADDTTRTEAAATMAMWPCFSGPVLGRHGATLDDRAWSAVSDAFVRAEGGYESAAPLVSAARMTQGAHRTRLLALAHRLAPDAGVDHTPEEIEAVLHMVLVEWADARCASGHAERIAVLGHQAAQPLLERLRNGPPESPGGSIACAALGEVAEAEDVPAIRTLLLAGKANLARTLASLQAIGISAATDALLDALAAGRVSTRITQALREAPDRERVVEVATKWVAGQGEVDEAARDALADLFMRLDARDTAPTLIAWSRSSSSEHLLETLAHALLQFGEPRGVEMLVHVLGERKTRFPCRPSTPEELAAARSPGRLRADGFDTYDRSRAAEALLEISGPGVFDFPRGWTRASRHGPSGESTDDSLDRAAVAYRAWWTTVRASLRRDPLTGRWESGR